LWLDEAVGRWIGNWILAAKFPPEERAQSGPVAGSR
jgi:hypothetical protein